MKLIKSFILFLKKPEPTKPVSLSFIQSIFLIFNSIPVYLLFIVICTILFIPLSIFDLMPDLPSREPSDFVWIVFFAPLLEEFFFRLPLRNFSHNIFISFALGFYAITKPFIGVPFAVIVGVIIIALPYIPIFFDSYHVIVNRLFQKYFTWYFFIIAFLFGLLHITNLVEISKTDLFLSPIIVFYQILIGLFLGFVRVRYQWGIFYAIMIHSLFNSIPVIIKLL